MQKLLVSLMLLIIIVPGLLPGQGTPHTIYGVVGEESGGYPDSACITFEAWISGRGTERIRFGDPGTSYSDSLWTLNTGHFPTEPETGETLIVAFADTCNNLVDTISIILDMSEPSQEAPRASLHEIITPVTLTLLAPDGEEIWWGTRTVSWTSTGAITYINLEYSLDNGESWTNLATAVPNTGSFNWVLPNTTSANCLVRISAPERGISDTSDAPFTIVSEPGVIAPAHNETISGGSLYTLRWIASVYFLRVRIELSQDGGAHYTTLIDSTPNDGQETLEIPLINSSECYIKISALMLPDYFAISEQFTIETIYRDTIPPARIMDLAVTDSTEISLRLEWTAPGDDSSFGIAAGYEIRYNTLPIDESNWATSFIVELPPVPSTAGTPEMMWLSGLNPATTYYIGIRAYDEAGNFSGISNIASGRTLEFIVPDTIPPQWVYLELIEVGYDMVLIGWFATGDDGWEGSADHYLFALSDRRIDAFNWDSLPHFLGPTPAPPGTYQRYTIAGLTPGTTYYLACKVYDEAGNPSRISNTLLFTTAPVDTIPPARITDLRVSDVTSTTVRLAWTSPGDDWHMGRASGYEIRYHIVPIDPFTWFSATALPDPPVPLEAGETQMCLVSGLTSGAHYYFAIRAYDDASNWSEISNVVESSTVGIIRAVANLICNEDTSVCPYVDLDTIFYPPHHPATFYYDNEFLTVSVNEENILCITPAPNWNGRSSVELKWLYDDEVYSCVFDVIVNPVNDPPYFISYPTDTIALVGLAWEYDADAEDIDGDILRYSLLSAPEGMSINETNGLIRFVPPPYLEGGYSVKVRVSDGYLSAEQDFTIHVMKETHENFAPRDLACGVGYNGSIPLSWMPPAILSTGAYGSLGLVFSHYTIYRSTNYSAGFTMLADSIISTTYNDVNCEAGRVYFYKVRAVYRVPYFLSNYSNTSSGVSLPSSLYYSTYIWHGVNIDGYLEEAEWERALRINLGTKAKVLIQNDERHMYIGLRGVRGNIATFRFYFDDDYSRSWDETYPSDEGDFIISFGDSRVFFEPQPSGIPSLYYERGCAWRESGDTITAEIVLETRDDEALYALPGDTLGVLFLLTPSGDTPFVLPEGSDPREPATFATLIMGNSGGSPTVSPTPSSFTLNLEEGSRSTFNFALSNTGYGLVLFDLSTAPFWMSVSPGSGMMPAFTSASFTANISAETLAVGVYPSQIIFNTNAGPVFLPCTLNVTPFVPSRYLELSLPVITYGSAGAIVSVPLRAGELYTNRVNSIMVTVGTDGSVLRPMRVEPGEALPPDWADSLIDITQSTISFILSGRAPLGSGGEIARIIYFVPLTARPGDFTSIVFADVSINDGRGPIPRTTDGLYVIGDRATPAWSITLRVSDGSNTFFIVLGAQNLATSAYDPAFDIPTMPTMPGDFVAFTTSSDGYRLTQDIRSLSANRITWFLSTLNGSGTISWDPTSVPQNMYLNERINMRVDSTYTFELGQTLTITYIRPAIQTFSYHLYPGWNFISLPFVPINANFHTLFPEALVDAYTYEPEAGVYVVRRVLEPGRAYWILYPAERTVEIEGSPLDSVAVVLSRGWNGIGPLMWGVGEDELGVAPEGAIISGTLFFWDARPDARRYVNSRTLLPGFGYWVYANENCVVRIPGRGTAKRKTLSLENLITLRSSGGSVLLLGLSKNSEISIPALPSLPFAKGRELDKSLIYNRTPQWEFEFYGGRLDFEFVNCGYDYELYIDGARSDFAEGLELSYEPHRLKIRASEIPDQFNLIGAAPNPFNIATNIVFELPAPQKIMLVVYDILGHRIYQDSRSFEQGLCRMRFEAKGLSSGVYFYRLLAGSDERTGKLIIMK